MSTPNAAARVYPTPREMHATKRRVRVDRMVIVVSKQATQKERFASELLAQWIADDFLVNVSLCEGRGPRGAKTIRVGRAGKVDVPAKKEGYALEISPRGIVAAGRDDNGTLYAVATLMQLLTLEKGALTAPVATVRDWPRLPIRTVHLYMPSVRGIAFFKRYVRDFLLRYKFNGIILETGGGVRFRSHPEVSTAWRRTVMELYAHGESVWKTGEGCPRGPKNRFGNSIHRGIGEGGYMEPEDLRAIVDFARDVTTNGARPDCVRSAARCIRGSSSPTTSSGSTDTSTRRASACGCGPIISSRSTTSRDGRSTRPTGRGTITRRPRERGGRW